MWPKYQVPSLAGVEDAMLFDGMRGLGDAASLEAAKQAVAKARAISDAKVRARAMAEFYARCNKERANNGLPELPGSVYEDLANRGVDPGTAPIRVPKDSAGNFIRNPDGSFFVETITPGGATVPGVVVPAAPSSISPAMVVGGLAAAAALFFVVKKFT